MANNTNTFDTKKFLSGAFFAPIALGEHTVTLGKVQAVIEEKDNGDDASYIATTLTFANGREVNVRFYSVGAQIFCNQLRQQLDDQKDYDSIDAFLRTLKGKSVQVWVSKRTYTNKNDEIKSTLQYDFIEPNNSAEDEEEIL